MKNITIDNIDFNSEKNLGIIVGPCVIENRDHSLKMADNIKKISMNSLKCQLYIKVLLIKLIGLQFHLFEVQELKRAKYSI